MSTTNMTDKERQILAAAWHCFDTQPKINFTKLAEIMGYKNAATASACFAPVKKKLLAAAGGDASPAATPKKRGKASPTKGKGKRTAEEAEADDDEEALEAKAKKAKKAKKDGDEEVQVKAEDEAEVSE